MIRRLVRRVLAVRGRRARPPGKIRVSKGEIARFVGENRCVANWLKKYRSGSTHLLVARPDGGLSGSRLNKARILCRFFKWLRIGDEERGRKPIDLSPSELLERHRTLRLSETSGIEDRKWLLNLVLEHSRDNSDFEDYADRRKYDIFGAVKSFVDYHEVPLTIAKNVYGRKRKKKNRRKQITIMEAKEVLGRMSQRNRAISMIQLQGGLGIGEVLNGFNYMWFDLVKPQLDMGRRRLKIEFDERKGNQTPYFTFISRDGIHELRKWLLERQRIIEKLLAEGKKIDTAIIDGEPVFISYRGNPLREQSFCHQLKEKTGGKVTSHMFRKLFHSEATVPDRGIHPRIVKFFMGHITDAMDDEGGIYGRNPEIREGIFEKEYAKLEPYINIYSSSVVSRRTDPLLQDIEQFLEVPSVREAFESIVEGTKGLLSERLKRQKIE